jgi:hypothetical protein
MQALLVVEKALIRKKRVVGLIIAGVLAPVTLITSTVASTVVLTQGIQMAHYVNNLAKNTSLTLQENINSKIET